MAHEAKAPRQVRPRVKVGGAKSPTIAFRTRGDLYERLKASAEARSFSLSEEIEHRLNRSMDTAGDHFAEMALQLIADNWRAIQSLSRHKMTEDKFTLQACCEAAYRATELLAGVNGIDLNVGLLAALGSEGRDIEAGKQLGHAIVYHRELLHMKDPPAQAAEVYEANVIEALTKRVATMRNRLAEAAEPPAFVEVPIAAEPPAEPTRAGETAPLPDGLRHATPEEVAAMKPARGQLPPSIGDRALFDEAVSGLPLVKAERAEASRRRQKAPLDVGAGSPDAAAAPARRKRARATP